MGNNSKHMGKIYAYFILPFMISEHLKELQPIKHFNSYYAGNSNKPAQIHSPNSHLNDQALL